MGKSFYLNRGLEQLRTASQVFSDLINSTPTAFGLTAPLALSYKNLNDDYADKLLISEAPETRSKVSITNRNNARLLLVAKASELAKIVEATTTVTDGQKEALGLSVRATPTPVGAPGNAYDFKVGLKPNGSLELKWKCNNPVGCGNVIYQIYRKVEGAAEFTYIGGAGQREFIDTTVPSGVATIIYSIQATRSTAVGDPVEFVVNFGTTAGGLTTIKSVDTAPKLAA